MPVKWDELLDAYEFVSAGGDYIEFRAWVCRGSGKFFFWDSDSSERLEEDEFASSISIAAVRKFRCFPRSADRGDACQKSLRICRLNIGLADYMRTLYTCISHLG